MAKLIEPRTLPGFRDFLPAEAKKRQWLRSQMIAVFEKWGYEPLETPTVEPLEIFQGEIGEDEKLFFKFKDPGRRDVALRYDQTVPTCRVVGQYFNELKFPFRRYQIQSNFRAEKPQKGRYREFVQADIDILGIESPIADAECIAISIDLYLTLGFKKPVALINNRDLLAGVPYPAIASIDKLKKIGQDGVISDMVKKGINKDLATKYLKTVKALKPDDKLNVIFEYLQNSGFSSENYRFEPTLARSFSYSQGPIWEMIIEGYDTASFSGSVGGGERYDDLVERISGKKVPATGIAFGFDRTLEAIEECGLLPKFEFTSRVMVSVFSSDLFINPMTAARVLRDNKINTELYPDSSAKLDKQLKYADQKGIPFVVIIGPEEAVKNIVTVKNLLTKSQTSVTLDECVKLIGQSSP